MFAKLSVQSCASFDWVEECGLVHILEYRQYFILVRQSVCVEDCVVVVVVSIVQTVLYGCILVHQCVLKIVW